MRKTLVTTLAAACLLAGAAAIVVAQAQTAGGKPPAPATAKTASMNAQLPKMVDVGKTWCIPCKKMVAVLQEAELRYKGRATIEFIDLDKKPEAAQEYQIQMIPTQIFYTTDGKEFERHVGYLPFEDVEKVFTKMGVERSS